MKKILAGVAVVAAAAGGLFYGLGTVPDGRKVIAVCSVADGQPQVRWFGAGETVPESCGVVTSADNPTGLLETHVSAGDDDTDLVLLLRSACTPCPVSGRAWGPCPHCLVTPGGCAEACRQGG